MNQWDIRDEMFQRLVKDRLAGDGDDIMHISRAICRHTIAEPYAKSGNCLALCVSLARTIPDFTDWLRLTVADAFGDEPTVKKLKKRIQDRLPETPPHGSYLSGG